MIESVNEAPNDLDSPGYYLGVSFLDKEILPAPYFLGFAIEYGTDRADAPSAYDLDFGSLGVILGYDIFTSSKFEVDISGDFAFLYLNSSFDTLGAIQNIRYPSIALAGNDYVDLISLKTGVTLDLIYLINDDFDLGLEAGVNFALNDYMNPWEDGTNDSWWNFGLKLTYKFDKPFEPNMNPEGVVDSQKKKEEEEENYEDLGVPILGNEVGFLPNTNILSSTARTKLQELLQKLNEDENLTLEVRVFTKAKGNRDMLNNLAKTRAKMVADWLVKNGIKADRVNSIGVGKAKIDSSGKTKGERVEFYLSD